MPTAREGRGPLPGSLCIRQVARWRSAAYVQVISWTQARSNASFRRGRISPTARLAWHPSGQYLAVSGDARRITVWDIQNWRFAVHLNIAECPPDTYAMTMAHSSVAQLLGRAFVPLGLRSGQRLLEVHEFKNQACDIADGADLFGDPGDKAVVTELTRGVCRTLTRISPPAFRVSAQGQISSGPCLSGIQRRRFGIFGTFKSPRTFARSVFASRISTSGRLIVGCNAGILRFSRRIETSPAVPDTTPAAARTLPAV